MAASCGKDTPRRVGVCPEGVRQVAPRQRGHPAAWLRRVGEHRGLLPDVLQRPEASVRVERLPPLSHRQRDRARPRVRRSDGVFPRDGCRAPGGAHEGHISVHPGRTRAGTSGRPGGARGRPRRSASVHRCSGSIRNVTTVSESWLAASSSVPVGSSAKFRGVLPRVGSLATYRRPPVSPSISKTAMLFWCLIEPYTNRPFAET